MRQLDRGRISVFLYGRRDPAVSLEHLSSFVVFERRERKSSFFFLLSNSLRKVSVSIRVPFETFSLEKGSELLYRINRFRKYFYGWIKNGWNLALMLEKDVWGRRESKIVKVNRQGKGNFNFKVRFDRSKC